MFKQFLVAACILLQVTFAQAALPFFDSSGKELPSLAPMLKTVNPAVVNISTYSNQQANNNPLLNDPFFRRFFNIPDQGLPNQAPQKRQQSAGSGVIVDKSKGIVITNYHVVKGADEVLVALVDGRSFTAEVKGSDPDLDIAILAIEGDDLSEVPLGNSEALQVGDFVVAIGNPFGLGQTVTTGIVSALDRTGLGIEGYENFIQTDASINPGNSGGALVDLSGKLIGINTAIIAPAGGNVGIGFAIPTNMVKASMEQILKSGEVKRGQIGVVIQDITPDLRKAFELKNGQQGVLIASVGKNTPAEKAGLRPGDVVIKIEDRHTTSSGQLRSHLSMLQIGEEIEMTILREGKIHEIDVTVGSPMADGGSNSVQLHPLLTGVSFENNPDGEGVLVTGLAPNSAAAYSGIRIGDVIVGANKRRVQDMNSFSQALSLSQKAVLLHVDRNGGSLYVVIR